MRVTITGFVLILGVCSPGGSQSEGIRDAVISALNWHYRWIEPIPPDVSSFECSLAAFAQQSFAYCRPGQLSMDIETGRDQSARVVSIAREHWDFERALADFRAHRNPGQALQPIQRISIPLRTLGTCKVDWNKTEQAVGTALSQRQKGPLEKKGLQLRYPLMCESVPFYLLYLMQDNKIRSIWQFEVSPGGFDLIWSFDAGTQQRKIPELAAENLKKDDLWYQPLK